MSNLTKRSVKAEFEKTLLANDASLIKMSADVAKQLRAIADDLDKVSRSISQHMKQADVKVSSPKLRR